MTERSPIPSAYDPARPEAARRRIRGEHRLDKAVLLRELHQSYLADATAGHRVLEEYRPDKFVDMCSRMTFATLSDDAASFDEIDRGECSTPLMLEDVIAALAPRIEWGFADLPRLERDVLHEFAARPVTGTNLTVWEWLMNRVYLHNRRFQSNASWGTSGLVPDVIWTGGTIELDPAIHTPTEHGNDSSPRSTADDPYDSLLLLADRLREYANSMLMLNPTTVQREVRENPHMPAIYLGVAERLTRIAGSPLSSTRAQRRYTVFSEIALPVQSAFYGDNADSLTDDEVGRRAQERSRARTRLPDRLRIQFEEAT